MVMSFLRPGDMDHSGGRDGEVLPQLGGRGDRGALHQLHDDFQVVGPELRDGHLTASQRLKLASPLSR